MHFSSLLALSLLLSVAPAHAKGKRSQSGASTAKATGASQLGRADFVRCVEESVLGRKDEACRGRGDAKECVGLKRALEYAALKTECLKKDTSQDGCQWWGHKLHTQPEWLSIASGHLTRFGGCIDAYYETEGANTFEQARGDATLVALIGRLPDGAGALRLNSGAVLKRTLEGETLGMIFLDSPFRQDFTTGEAYTMKDAADTPIPLPVNPQGLADGSVNPAQAGEDFAKLARDFIDEESVTATSSSLAPYEPASAPAPKPAFAASTAGTTAFTPTRRPRSLYSLNLDRTLFELVNDAYVRHAAALMGTDDFIRTQKLGPAKDLRGLLERGESL